MLSTTSRLRRVRITRPRTSPSLFSIFPGLELVLVVTADFTSLLCWMGPTKCRTGEGELELDTQIQRESQCSVGPFQQGAPPNHTCARFHVLARECPPREEWVGHHLKRCRNARHR